MKTSNKQRGDPHPFSWPKISSFLTLQALDLVTKHIEENKEWNVCEKIDGCNVCVSNQGWIASRNKIIGHIEDKTLHCQVFQGANLSGVFPLHHRLVQLQNHLAETFFPHDKNFELLAYGELVLPGSASTCEDIYNYKQRNFSVGSIHVFALGLVLKDMLNIPFIFEHGFKVNRENNTSYFIVPMNNNLSKLLKQFDIEHLAPKKTDFLQNILKNSKFQNNLLKRKKEGYVLSGNNGNGYIKWKYYKSRSPQLDIQSDLLVESQQSSTAKAVALDIQAMYKQSNQFMTGLVRSGLATKVNDYFVAHCSDIEQRLQDALNFGLFYHNLVRQNIVEEIYTWCKKNSISKYDPQLKIQLKRKIEQQFRIISKDE
jgi:hypothetical protein